MRAFKILLALLVFSCFSYGQQLNKLGYPLIRNFLPEEYNGTEQNWSIIQDDRGIMYFGSYDKGILEYDGKTWRMISVPNNAPVNSFAKDNKGTIYVGTTGDFGYLQSSSNGSVEFISLSNTLNDSIKSKLSHIYKTYCYDNKILFCSKQYVFVYNGKNVTPVYLGVQSVYANFLTFIANNHIYIGSYLKGLRELYLRDTSIHIGMAPKGDFFCNINILSVIPQNINEVLIITDAGFYRYNQISGAINSVDNSDKFIQKLLENSIPYAGIKLYNRNIAIGTLQSDKFGFIEIDSLANPIEVLNSSKGLQADQVSYLFQNNDSPVWMALFDGGISKSEINSAIRRFSTESGINYIIMDIVEFNNTLYIATFNGVYYQAFDNDGFPVFLPVKNITGSVWDLTLFTNPNNKSILLAGSYADGLYEIKGDEAVSINEILKERVKDVELKCYKLYQSPINPSLLYVGMPSGLTYVKYENGNWVDSKYISKKEIRFEVRSIVEEKDRNLWISTTVNGIYIIFPDGSIKNFTTEQGLPSLKNLELFEENDSLYVLTTNGIYQFNTSDSTFSPSNLLGKNNSVGNGIYRLIKTKDGYAEFCYDENENKNWIQLITKDQSNKYSIFRYPFNRLPNKWADALYYDSKGVLWTGISKELYSYNPNIKRDYNIPFNTIIRKVISKGDTILFNGAFKQKTEDGIYISSLNQHPEQVLKLPYRFNRLVFEFGSTFYEWEDETTFSYFLEGGADENWSIWNKEAKATYTNLREGNYTFKVKAKNIYGTESTVAEYKFSLTPPWYRSILAFILYGILFIVFVWMLVRWNTRRLIAEKERLEQIVKERTAEVVRQKGELEIQRDKIAQQNEEIKSSIHYASRIQGAILSPVEQIVNAFPNYFILYLPRDIVSGDFYWIHQVGNKKISVVADCTGHGVPGGFMSMLGMSLISQIVNKGGELHPADILDQLRQSIVVSLHQTGEVGGSKDGMDIAVYTIDETTNTLEFAGANNPLILIRDGEVQHIKGDKMPIGIHLRINEKFTNNVIELKRGDRLYTFSDGYVDQFGGPDMRKFMIKNFKELLLQIHQKPMAEQREILNKTLSDWHGSSPRIDDVVVMGVQY